MQVTIAGIIETCRQVVTKNNERMAFLKIADLTDSIEAVVFPSLFKDNVDIFCYGKMHRPYRQSFKPQRRKSIIIEAVKEI